MIYNIPDNVFRSTILFNIGEKSVVDIIKTESDAIDYLNKLTELLCTSFGWYGQYSSHLHGMILWFIYIKYPNLSTRSKYLMNEFFFKTSLSYMVLTRWSYPFKYYIAEILSDVYYTYDNNFMISEFLLKYVYDDQLKSELDINKQAVSKLLNHKITCLTKDNKIEVIRNYDLLMWQHTHFVVEAPEVKMTDEEKQKTIDCQLEMLPLFKEHIKESYGVE